MKDFISDDNIVHDQPTQNKHTLIRGDDVWEDEVESLGQNFSNNLVNDITKADWHILLYHVKCLDFGNEGNKCVIDTIQ